MAILPSEYCSASFVNNALSYLDIELTISKGFDQVVFLHFSGELQSIYHIAPTIISLIEAHQLQAEFYGKPINPYSFIYANWGFATALLGQFDKGEKLREKTKENK